MFFKKINFCVVLVFGIVQLFHRGYSSQVSSVILKTSYSPSKKCSGKSCYSSVKINNSTFIQKQYERTLLVVLEAKTQKVTSYNMTIEEAFNKNKTLTKYVKELFKIPDGSILFFLPLYKSESFLYPLLKHLIYKGSNSSKLKVAIVVDCIDPCAFVTGESLPLVFSNSSVEKNFQIRLKVEQEKVPKKSHYALLAGIFFPALLVVVIALTIVIRYWKRNKLIFFKTRQPFSEISFRKNAFTIHQSLNTIEHAVLPSGFGGKEKQEIPETKKYFQTEVKNHYVSIRKDDSNNTEYEKIKQDTTYDYIEIDGNEKNTMNAYYCPCSPETVIMEDKKGKLQLNYKPKFLKLFKNCNLNQKHGASKSLTCSNNIQIKDTNEKKSYENLVKSNDADVYETLTEI